MHSSASAVLIRFNVYRVIRRVIYTDIKQHYHFNRNIQQEGSRAFDNSQNNKWNVSNSTDQLDHRWLPL